MAKGKHSTALFEVINKPARTGVAPPPVITRAPLHTSLTPAIPPAAAAGSPLTPAPVNSVKLDPDRHQVSLRVSYTTALVTLFAVIVVISLAYLIGRGLNSGPQTASASSEDLKKGPATPTALNVAPQTTTTPPRQTVGTTPQQRVDIVKPTGPVAAPTNAQRIVGQNYVIMQSYPDEATAKEAQAALLAAGIPCTIERGPANWAMMSWYSVIGTQGFDHVLKNPQLDAYCKAIENVKYGEKSKFKKFDPRPYKWK